MAEKLKGLFFPDPKALGLFVSSYIHPETWKTWATEGKGIEKLHLEMREGESNLRVIHGKNSAELQRHVRKVTVDIYGKDPNGQRYQLVEIGQYLNNGRVLDRRKRKHSLTEKIKPGESPQDALRRALEEELHLAKKLMGKLHISKRKYNETREVEESKLSFPGLLNDSTHYHFPSFTLLIKNLQDVMRKSIEKDKISVFAWMPTNLNDEEKIAFKQREYERFIDAIQEKQNSKAII